MDSRVTFHSYWGAAEQIVEREPRERVSQEAFVIQSWRYRAAASTPPLCGLSIMTTITVNDLAIAAENEFAFLESLGFPLTEWSEISPESFKGGFKLIFRNSSGTKVTILYTDYEFQVRAGSKEIFGATKHESFAGNMFSREHLIPALPKLRAALEPALRSFAAAAT